MISHKDVANRLSASLLSADWNEHALLSQMKISLGPTGRKAQRLLVREILNGIATEYPPSPKNLTAILTRSRHFERIARSLSRAEHTPPIVLSPAKFSPTAAFANLNVPHIAAAGDLARWLDISIAHLDWIADSKRQHGTTHDSALRHYHYSFINKANGLPRLLESPKPKLKAVQRRILREILDRVPVHDRAQGFVKGRSCRSAANVHVAEACVVSVDLKNFFFAVATKRIHGLFRSLGYPWSVARLFTGLCTTATPLDLFKEAAANKLDWHVRKLLTQPHLPQGAPTSPMLANLCAWRMDQRLAGLARRFDANYTRYADDITFSGDATFAREVEPLLAAVETIAGNEGFSLNAEKTRIMHAQNRQRVTGIVVNAHANIAREDYDSLKATLYNCARNGPLNENREGHDNFRAHLAGKVGWVESINPPRGAKLRALFDRIAW